MKKCYIAGQISGLDLETAELNFTNAESQVLDLGYEPINPMKILPPDDKWTWTDYMLADIAVIMRECKAMYMLDNWTYSKGARIEHTIAEAMDFEIIYQ